MSMVQISLVTTLSLTLLTTTMAAQDSGWEADFKDPDLQKRMNDEAGPRVPTVKHIDPAWVAELPKRGEPTVYRGHDLENIAMPVGGITCGQLYLSGDGRLYLWDIFNQMRPTTWDLYVHPMQPVSSLSQGFSVRITGSAGKQVRTLDQAGFADTSFHGQYPIGHIEYHDPACPLNVALDAFSPFIPLNVDDSSLPLTVMRYTMTNTSSAAMTVELGGWLQNQVSCFQGQQFGGTRLDTKVEHAAHVTFVQGSSSPYHAAASAGGPRPDVIYEDFEGTTYGQWKTEGTAFGTGPAQGAPNPIQSLHGLVGHGLANSFNGTDEATGTLTSPAFAVQRAFITFLIAGGNNPGRECINLLVDGKVVHTITGNDNDNLRPACFEVHALEGKKVQLQIVDASSGGWGHVDVDQIVFTDTMPASDLLAVQPDYGTMGLGLLEPEKGDWASPDGCDGSSALFATYDHTSSSAADHQELKETSQTSQDGHLVSGLMRTLSLKPHESRTVTFVVAWSFPHLTDPGAGRFYGIRFPTALTAARYLADHFDTLYGMTTTWRDTWYGSSLPYWFLDRTLDNISTLATSTSYRFGNGDFWGFEGVGSCNGTCTHVWSYEQAMGRLFPELDINLREHTDYNPKFAFKADGQIANRGNHEDAATDGQAGTIMRTYRDYLMSPDDTFLKSNWASIKKAEEWLIAQDGTDDGLLKHNQRNTLDAEWFGEVAWLSSLYIASLHAAEAMATEVGDTAFATHCHQIETAGEKNIVKTLFNGEYFQDLVDPKHLDSVNSGTGCEIDQVLGQSWAFQVGLGRIIPATETRKALQALWKYNFTTDAGAYRKVNPAGRVYAVDGESGMLMCTFPKPDWTYENAKGGPGWTAGYFNECMNGFEHQVAGHMLWEGMVAQGLALERAVHDRYSATKRNPYNEIECGDHYARSMASYGVFLAACGFNYNGPKGVIGFDPRLGATDFKAAFTAAEGWGSYSQKFDNHVLLAELDLKYGKLRVKTVNVSMHGLMSPSLAKATLDTTSVPAVVHVKDGITTITLEHDVTIAQGHSLKIILK